MPKAAAHLGAPPSGPKIEGLIASLTQCVGADGVSTDLADRQFYSQDIWSVAAETVDAVVSPKSLDDLAKVLAAATSAGCAIAPRGGGMSYTSAYIPTRAHTISLDLSRMNGILEIDADNMTVTVQAGCTWAALDAALAPKGLRTPFWGPMSGLTSTVGGGLSQLNAMFGAGHYGTSSESVVGMTIVLADGRVLRTGARADGANPFYRHYGPDLTGLFCGDAGVFGVKAEITLRLMRRPQHEGYVSFAFATAAQLLASMSEMSRAGLACEMCAFDPGLTKVRMRRAALAADLKVLGAVVAKEKSLGKGLLSAAKIAMGGRNFIEAEEYSVHVVCEGRSKTGVEEDIQAARAIAKARGGHEIENTIAKVIRANPFPPLNSMIGPDGERWAPVHGVVSHSRAPELLSRIDALFADMAPAFNAHGIYTGYLFTSLSTNALIVEPVFYWPETRQALIDASVEPQHLAKLPSLQPNPEATAVVAEARRKVIEICAALGCGHFQIGRSYPYRQSRDEASWALIETVKTALDATGALNPDGLGLSGKGAH